jgi:F-type H+-transporting ATPase subunit delta
MANETLARRYANAVFAVAQERSSAQRVGDDLEALAKAIDSNVETQRFFTAPIVDRYTKEAAIAKAFEGKVDEVALHALLLLVRKHRETLLGQLLVQYRALQMQARGAEPLTVTSAQPLAEAELRALVERLEQIYGKKFDATATVDPNAIGGVRITMGDRRVDGTVAGRLEELTRVLFATN